MPLNAIDDTGIFLCCHEQEREDRKLQCVDQKPVTASLAFHQILIMASLFSCRHQTLRVLVSLSENTPVSVWVTWNICQVSEWNSLGAGDLSDPWAGTISYGQQSWCIDGRFLKVGSVASLGPLSGENPCCPYYRVGIIFKERAKVGDIAPVDSGKLMGIYIIDFYSFDPIWRAYIHPLNLGFAFCSYSQYWMTINDTKFRYNGISSVSVPMRHDLPSRI